MFQKKIRHESDLRILMLEHDKGFVGPFSAVFEKIMCVCVQVCKVDHAGWNLSQFLVRGQMSSLCLET